MFDDRLSNPPESRQAAIRRVLDKLIPLGFVEIRTDQHGRTDQNSNLLSKAILRACWQGQDEQGMQAARPWLHGFLTRVVGMKLVPPRESESIQASKRRWLTVRKEEALKIDPETAEVFWEYGSVLDPYGLYDLTYEPDSTGRNYFARAPESDVWVSFHDLPKAVRERLWTRIKAGNFDDDDLRWLSGDRPTKGSRSGSQIKRGANRAYVIARLRRDGRVDLIEQVESGALSVRGALAAMADKQSSGQ